MTLSLFLALALSLSPLAAREDAAPSVQAIVDLEHDRAAQRAFLGELARLRRHGASAAFRERLALERERQAARRAPVRVELAERGVQVLHELWLTESLLVQGSPQALAQLTALPGVESVARASLRRPATLKAALNANHHDAAGANQLTVSGQAIEGLGVTVAVIDTGIDTDMAGSGLPHKAFYEDADTGNFSGGIGGSRILSAEISNAFGNASTPEDFHGHGTRMASIVAGAKYNNVLGVADGAAPLAWVRSYRIDDDSPLGLASTFSMNIAIDAAAANPDVRVINMSYDGTADPELSPNPAFDAAALAGAVITLSAGNDGGASFFHGAFNVLPVGASDLQTMEPYDVPSIFVSAVGPLENGRRYPRLIAVGEDLTSAVPDNEATAVASNGTSGAAAIVAGTAALVIQADPSLTALQVRALLVNTAATVTLGTPAARGFGYLLSKSAVEAALDGLSLVGFGLPATRERFRVDLVAGEDFAAALTWNRIGPGGLPADLDLQLVSPQGLLVAASNHGFDNVESLRVTAPTTGSYELYVDVLNVEPGEFSIEYGLATSVPAMAIGLDDPCAAVAPFADVVQEEAVALASPLSEPLFAIKGCGFTGATGVTVAGSAADFDVLSDVLINAALPFGVGVGSQAVSVSTPSGALASSVTVGVAQPGYDASYTVGSQDALGFSITGEPSAFYVVLYSFSQAPTSLPGVLELGIGAAATDLYLLTFGTLDATGMDAQSLGLWPTFPPPAGVKVYQQAAVFSSAAGGDWVPSNVDSTLVIF